MVKTVVSGEEKEEDFGSILQERGHITKPQRIRGTVESLETIQKSSY